MAAGTHVVFDKKVGGFFLDKYPESFGPWSNTSIIGTNDSDRTLLIGGLDGYIRQPDDVEKDDDGMGIQSYWDSGPIEAPDGLQEITATEIQSFGFKDSDPITFGLFVGDSPDEVRQQTVTPAVVGTLINDPGFNVPTGLRRTAGAIKFRFTQTSATLTWALERIVVKFMPGAIRRR